MWVAVTAVSVLLIPINFATAQLFGTCQINVTQALNSCLNDINLFRIDIDNFNASLLANNQFDFNLSNSLTKLGNQLASVNSTVNFNAADTALELEVLSGTISAVNVALNSHITEDTASDAAIYNQLSLLNTTLSSHLASISNTSNEQIGVVTLELDAHIANDIARYVSFQSSLSSLNASLNSVANQTAINTIAISTNNAYSVSQFASQLASITTLNTEVASNTASISTVNTQVAANILSISALASQQAYNIANITFINSEIATNIAAISANNASAIAQFSSQSAYIAANSASISTLNTEVATNTANIASNSASIATLNSEVATNTASITSITTQQSYNTANITLLNTEVASNTANIASNSASITTLNTEVATNTANIATLTAQEAYDKSNITSIQNGLTTVTFPSITVGTASTLLALSATSAAGTMRYIPWTAFTVTVTAGTTNPTFGTGGYNVARYMLVDKTMFVQWQYGQVTAGSAGSGTYQFHVYPSGYTPDSSMYPVDTGNTIVGFCGTINILTASTSLTGGVACVTSTWVQATVAATASPYMSSASSGNFGTAKSAIYINVMFQVT